MPVIKYRQYFRGLKKNEVKIFNPYALKVTDWHTGTEHGYA